MEIITMKNNPRCRKRNFPAATSVKNIYIRWMYTLLLGMPSCAAALGDPIAGNRLPPVDDSKGAPELRHFLEQVRVAVLQRDVDLLQSSLDPEILIGFGPNEHGVDAAVTALLNPDSELWSSLESSIFLGGTFGGGPQGSYFCIPYVYSAFPDHLDASQHQVVVKPVQARSAPDESATPVPLPDYAIVRTDIGTPMTTKGTHGEEWAHIHVKDETAYIPADALRSPAGSRTCLYKRGEQWRIKAVIAGGD
jgi:hypothetical protein